jgi:hypothetical protein
MNLPDRAAALASAIENKSAKVGVVGLGYALTTSCLPRSMNDLGLTRIRGNYDPDRGGDDR